MVQEASRIKNTIVLTFWHVHCLRLMYFEVVWVLVSLGTQVQPQMTMLVTMWKKIYRELESTRQHSV